jgi:hypothetical protein
MPNKDALELENYQFRGLHPNVALGTASDRYAGWFGQIYSRERYAGRTSRRTDVVGGQSFVVEVLPVGSGEECFQHFCVLEIDFTFYRPLLENDGKPGQNYHVLRKYRQFLGEEDDVILKVPQLVFAQKLRRGGGYVENDDYLNAEIFTTQFYNPSVEILGSALSGLIFEQEYQRKKDRMPAAAMAERLDAFFESIPKDHRYHVELRTEAYLSKPVLEVMEKHGVGQVLSHWTWLPPLRSQYTKSASRFFNSGRQCIIRLMTPIGMRYEEAYARAHPFDRLVEGMLRPDMVEDTVRLMRTAIERGVHVNVIINNRAGGNAPMIARKIAERFLETEE